MIYLNFNGIQLNYNSFRLCLLACLLAAAADAVVVVSIEDPN